MLLSLLVNFLGLCIFLAILDSKKWPFLCILSLKVLEGLKCPYFKSNVAFYIIFSAQIRFCVYCSLTSVSGEYIKS